MRSLVFGAVLAVVMPLAAQAQEAGDAAAGEKAFAPCKACHNFQKNGVGPDLKGVVGRKAEKILLPMQPGDFPATYADIDDLVHETGFRPATPLKTGIGHFVDWYRTYHGV